MSFFDKVKQAAGGVADATKKGAGAAQTKAKVHGLRNKADEAAQKLGYLIVRERTEGTAAAGEADELVTQISDLEKQIAEAQAMDEEEAEGSEGQVEGDGGSEGEAPAS